MSPNLVVGQLRGSLVVVSLGVGLSLQVEGRGL